MPLHKPSPNHFTSAVHQMELAIFDLDAWLENGARSTCQVEMELDEEYARGDFNMDPRE